MHREYHPLEEGLFSHLAVHPRSGVYELKIDGNCVQFCGRTAEVLCDLLLAYVQDAERRRREWAEEMS